MQVQCPVCKKQLSFDSEIAHFCSNCGSSLVALKEESISQPSEPSGFGGITEAFSVKPPKTPDFIGETIVHDSNKNRDREDTLPEGSFVGPFRIVNTLGQGGMGTVYKAIHSETGQTVALKLLSRSVQST